MEERGGASDVADQFTPQAVLACSRLLDRRALRTMMAAAAYQARRVARTLKLSEIDREEAEHEILLVLLDRRRFFDPACGAWSSFTDRIARQAAQLVADAISADRRVRGGSLDARVDRETKGIALRDEVEAQVSSGMGVLEDLSLPIVVSRFVAELPGELALVASLALQQDGDLAAARRQSKLSTTEFYRRLREIRYRLVCLGIVRKRFGDGYAPAHSSEDQPPE